MGRGGRRLVSRDVVLDRRGLHRGSRGRDILLSRGGNRDRDFELWLSSLNSGLGHPGIILLLHDRLEFNHALPEAVEHVEVFLHDHHVLLGADSTLPRVPM